MSAELSAVEQAGGLHQLAILDVRENWQGVNRRQVPENGVERQHGGDGQSNRDQRQDCSRGDGRDAQQRTAPLMPLLAGAIAVFQQQIEVYFSRRIYLLFAHPGLSDFLRRV